MARALNDLFAAMDNETNRSENIFKVNYLEQNTVIFDRDKTRSFLYLLSKSNLTYQLLKGYTIVFGDI